MKLLLTNDDGIDADGLQELAELLSREHECWVVAPVDGKSCCSHSVCNADPLNLVERKTREWSVNGTPADCVRIAMCVLRSEPDWIISGVNQGGNLGVDTLYSGTVAAAREGAMFGIPSIAISQFMRRDVEKDWNQTAHCARNVISQIWNRGCRRGTFWNANLPALPPFKSGGTLVEDIDWGAKFRTVECALERAPLSISYVAFPPDEESPQQWDVSHSERPKRFLYQSNYPSRPRSQGSDVDHCFRGDATITSLETNWYCYEER